MRWRVLRVHSYCRTVQSQRNKYIYITFFLNRSNILGHKGEVAEEFGAIMKALWSGQFKYISPRDFKITIGKINDQFSGYEQQDSQELLLFLMDGLHEDLNKVTAAWEV